MKKNLLFGIIFLVVLICIMQISAISLIDSPDGTRYYDAEFGIKTPSINIANFFILKPGLEPANPVFGTVYLDASTQKIKFYTGESWKTIRFEEDLVNKCSFQKTCGEWSDCLSDRQSRECFVVYEDCSNSTLVQEDNCVNVYKTTLVEDAKSVVQSDLQTCTVSRQCGAWGDCINNYQTRSCFGVNEGCSQFEDEEQQECFVENPYQSEIEQAKQEIGTEVAQTTTESAQSGEINPEQTAETTTTTEQTTGEQIPSSAETIPVEEAIPEQLFDITFDLEDSTLSRGDKPVIWITLQNFGKRFIPSRLIYTIFDSEGKKVYTESEEVRVYTDQSIIKEFSNVNLDTGKYILRMDLEYAGITESFENGFEVKGGFFYGVLSWFKEVFTR